MTTAVTAKELTDRIAGEVGILTVNNIMQTIQIEKLEAKIAEDTETVARLTLLNEDFRTQINVLAQKVLPARSGTRRYAK